MRLMLLATHAPKCSPAKKGHAQLCRLPCHKWSRRQDAMWIVGASLRQTRLGTRAPKCSPTKKGHAQPCRLHWTGANRRKSATRTVGAISILAISTTSASDWSPANKGHARTSRRACRGRSRRASARPKTVAILRGTLSYETSASVEERRGPSANAWPLSDPEPLLWRVGHVGLHNKIHSPWRSWEGPRLETPWRRLALGPRQRVGLRTRVKH